MRSRFSFSIRSLFLIFAVFAVTTALVARNLDRRKLIEQVGSTGAEISYENIGYVISVGPSWKPEYVPMGVSGNRNEYGFGDADLKKVVDAAIKLGNVVQFSICETEIRRFDILKRIGSIEILRFTNCQISRSELESLCQHQKLRMIVIKSCHDVTVDFIEELNRRFQNVSIIVG